MSQQRLRLRRLTVVRRVTKLRFEPVSFLFLACFSKKLVAFFGANFKNISAILADFEL